MLHTLLSLGFSSPFYEYSSEIILVILIGFMLWGFLKRGINSITNWLLLIPIVMWTMEVAYDVGSIDDTGFWWLGLIGITFVLFFFWVAIWIDREMHGEE